MAPSLTCPWSIQLWQVPLLERYAMCGAAPLHHLVNHPGWRDFLPVVLSRGADPNQLMMADDPEDMKTPVETALRPYDDGKACTPGERNMAVTLVAHGATPPRYCREGSNAAHLLRLC